MEKLKRIYAHRELKDTFLFGEEEINQRDDKELLSETSFLYDEDTKLVYYRTNSSDTPVLFKSLFGHQYRFANNEIILVD